MRPADIRPTIDFASIHVVVAITQETDWAEIDVLCATLEPLQLSPAVSLNRAGAVLKLKGPEAALAIVEPKAKPLAGYFPFLWAAGRIADAIRPRGFREDQRRLEPVPAAG
jgi:RNA polymerase sigma-70 factor, ECF subfamily